MMSIFHIIFLINFLTTIFPSPSAQLNPMTPSQFQDFLASNVVEEQAKVQDEIFSSKIRVRNDNEFSNLPPIAFVPDIGDSLLLDGYDRSRILWLNPLTEASWKTLKQRFKKFPSKNNNQINIVDFGGTHGIDHVEAECLPAPTSRVGSCIPWPRKGKLHNWLSILASEHGYIPGNTLLGLPYDWRHHYHSTAMHTWRSKVVELIDTQYLKNKKRLVFIAQGMGCLYISKLLSEMSDSWKNQKIRSLVCIAPPLAGAPVFASALISGHWHSNYTLFGRFYSPFSNFRSSERLDFRSMEFKLGMRFRSKNASPGHQAVFSGPTWDDSFYVPNISHQEVHEMYKSIDSLYDVLPSRDLQFTASDQSKIRFEISIIDRTKKLHENYNVSNLIEQISNVMPKSSHMPGTSMPHQPSSSPWKAPGVRTLCLVSRDVATAGSFSYRNKQEPVVRHVDGDGLVPLESALLCSDWQSQQDSPVDITVLRGISHEDLLYHLDLSLILAREKPLISNEETDSETNPSTTTR